MTNEERMTYPHISQLCAGLKITRKPTPLFFTFSGEGRSMTFKKLKYPLKNWKPAHTDVSSIGFKVQYKMKVSEKTDWRFVPDRAWTGLHDRWKRHMQCKDELSVQDSGDAEAFFQGDSGGPLWVREEEGGTLPIAYLVCKRQSFHHHWNPLLPP